MKQWTWNRQLGQSNIGLPFLVIKYFDKTIMHMRWCGVTFVIVLKYTKIMGGDKKLKFVKHLYQ